MTTRLVPKLFSLIKDGYTKHQFLNDLLAGFLVGIVALPLAIAFAIASGVKPEQGLYTAVVAGFVIAVLGGSRVQVSGPTGAFIVVVYGIVQQYGYEGLAVATMIAGVMQIGMGLSGMGVLLKFIPLPLTIGFTAGIAVIIFSSQVPDLLGLHAGKIPADFVHKWQTIYNALNSTNLWAIALSALCIVVIVYFPKISKRIPGSLVAVIVATIFVKIFDLPIDTIGSRFGSVPSTLPSPHLPFISWELIQKMISPALTIALLGAIESLLSAVVADGMIGTRHRSNMELVAQGVGNIASPLFLGIPATGAIARTATNVKNGGRTPVSAIGHSITLLLIMLFFGSWAALIPMPALAAILVIVAYNMSEWRSFVRLFKSPRSDIIVLVTTFLLTVLVDLTVAIEVGVILAAMLFIRSMSDETEIEMISEEMRIDRNEEAEDPRPISIRNVPKGVQVFEIHGPLFFGAINRFKDAISTISAGDKVLVIRMRNVRRIDATGLHALEDVLRRLKSRGGSLLFSGLHPQAKVVLERAGFLDEMGRENICEDIDVALELARGLVVNRSS